MSYGLEMFKNRDAQRSQILAWLADPATRMVTVFGHRGIGKSSLAAKVVETLAADNSGYHGIVNLSTRTDGVITIERIFFACAELADPEMMGMLDRLWAGHREARDKLIRLFETLEDSLDIIVLDNIEDNLNDDGRPANHDLETIFDVIFRLPRGPRLLITSQVPVALDPAMRRMEARLHLRDGLPMADSVELLRELDRDGEAGLLDAPLAELELAARRLHGVPRALELTVGALTGDHLTIPTLDDVLKDFAARGDIVDQLAHDRYQRLDGEARITLDVLAVFRSPVTREPIEWVIHPLAPSLDAARALSHLAHVHMVSVDRRTKEFALHPLDADIAYSALSASGPLSRQVLERRVAEWFEHNSSPPPWRTVKDVANHRQAFEHRLRAEDYNESALILDSISEFLIWQGSRRETIDMHIAIQDHLSDEIAILANLVGYGQIKQTGGPVEESIEPLQQAIALAEILGDLPRLRRALYSLGDAFRFLRRLREAINALSRAADVAAQLGDIDNQSHALLCLSLSHTYLDELPLALAVVERLDRLAEETGDVLVVARSRDARSAASIAGKRWAEAIDAADQAIIAYQEAGMPEALGYTLNVQGIGLLGMGRVADAVEALNRAWNESVSVEAPRAEGFSHYNLAWAYWLLGDYEAARFASLSAVEAFRRAGCADVSAGENLAAAVAAMIAGDRSTVKSALTSAATAALGNSDLVPGEWLLAHADLA